MGDHDSERSEGCTTNSRDGEQFEEAGNIVTLSSNALLDFDLGVDVEKIPRSLERGVAKATQRPIGLVHLAPSNVPTGGLGAKENTKRKWNTRDKGRSKLQAPGNRAGIHDSQVGAKAQEDAKCRPQLPGHDEAAANNSGRVLSTENGDSGGFQTHPNSQQEAGNEELRPALGDSRSNGCKSTENSGDEDGSTTTEETVDRVREPAAQNSRRDIWAGIDDTYDPLT